MNATHHHRTLTLTKTFCDRLTPTDKDIEYTDTKVQGLKFIITATGYKSFMFRYTYASTKRAITLGRYPAISLDEARKIALHHRALLDQGHDPKITTTSDKPLFKDFAHRYLNHVKVFKTSWKDDQAKLTQWMIPQFGDLSLDDITRERIDQYRTHIHQVLSPASANRHHALISAMLTLAVSWELLTKNPALGMKRYKELSKVDGVLDTQQVNALLNALDHDPNISAVNALKLLLFTGLRRSEVTQARWQDYSANHRSLYLPTTKAGKSRYVPLNDLAIAVIESQLRKSNYIFYGQDETRPINNLIKPFQRALKRAGITKPVRIHDLRHTFASHAVLNGVSLYETQQLLGHASSQMTQRYAHLNNEQLREASHKASISMSS